MLLLIHSLKQCSDKHLETPWNIVHKLYLLFWNLTSSIFLGGLKQHEANGDRIVQNIWVNYSHLSSLGTLSHSHFSFTFIYYSTIWWQACW